MVARYAARVNGVTEFFLTKLDVLTGWERIPVCVAYDVDGVRHDEMPMTQTEFHHAKPIYEYFDGWDEDISEAAAWTTCRRTRSATSRALEEMSGAPFWAVGVGPGREQTLVVLPPDAARQPLDAGAGRDPGETVHSGGVIPPRHRGLPFVGATLEYVRDPLAMMRRSTTPTGRSPTSTSSASAGPCCSVRTRAGRRCRTPTRPSPAGPGWGQLVGPFFDRGLMLLDFEEHHRHRRIMQEAFTRDRLAGVHRARSARRSPPGLDAAGSRGRASGPTRRSRSSPSTWPPQVFMGGAELADEPTS